MLLDYEAITTDPVGSGPSPASRFLFYSHDGYGLGHTRRHLAVARALTELAPESSILLATGTDFAGRLGLTTSIDVLKLPELRKVSNPRIRAETLTNSRRGNQGAALGAASCGR